MINTHIRITSLKYIFVSLIFITAACKKQIRFEKEKPSVQKEMAIHQKPVQKHQESYTAYEKTLLAAGLKDIKQLIPEIQVSLKYATADNFMGEVLYTELFHAFLQAEAAQKLKNAQNILREKDSSLSLLVYDAVRPNSIQHKMWNMVVNTPKQRYVAHPGKGSLHNYGCAVDLTIVKNGIPLDMGTPYDFFGKKAQPRYNSLFLKQKELSPEQVANRDLLRSIMKSAGFIPINSEWWHFNAFSISHARKHYKIVK